MQKILLTELFKNKMIIKEEKRPLLTELGAEDEIRIYGGLKKWVYIHSVWKYVMVKI